MKGGARIQFKQRKGLGITESIVDPHKPCDVFLGSCGFSWPTSTLFLHKPMLKRTRKRMTRGQTYSFGSKASYSLIISAINVNRDTLDCMEKMSVWWEEKKIESKYILKG